MTLRALPVLSLCLLAGASAAQESDPLAPGSAQLKRTEGVLHGRNRTALHHGEALTIVGLEQGDNDLRKSTPALARSNRVAALPDPEAAHARALALYEDGANFTSPPPRLRGSVTPEPSPAEPARARAEPQAAAEATPSKWPWILGFAVLVGGVLLWAKKRLHLASWHVR
ncbi:MAG: hypothetical protein EXS08_00410 [Planctomycetes bacterium]|nr:hypothetical protein [Planctomycetota bacterium]